MKFLQYCTDMLGRPLSSDIKRRIKKFFEDPTADNWNDIARIIINTSGLTIWQAVVMANPTFPKIGQRIDLKGKIIQNWRQIPTPYEVAKAIKNACK